MATSVKGLLKGLRYISQIFDEKEPEMQIGLPTDVKHVAHIGWDGPSAGVNNTPSWMNEFKSTPDSTQLVNSIGELDLSSSNLPSGSGELENQKRSRGVKSKRQPSTESSSSSDSSSRRGTDKTSRRHRSTCPTGDSTTTQDISGSCRGSRRRGSSNLGTESGSENSPGVPKHSHRRRSKGSSDGGSTRSSRSRGQNSLTDITLPPLEVVDEEKG